MHKKQIIKNRAFTLVELLVTITIFTLAASAVTYLAYAGYRYNNFIMNQAEIFDNLEKSMGLMTEEIREMRQADSGAFSIEEATDNELIYYSNIDDSPDVERVRYFLSGTCLKKGTIKPVGTPFRYPPGNEQVKNITCNATNHEDEPIFSFYSAYPSSSTQLSSPAQANQVKVIKIYIRISSTGTRPIPSSKILSTYVSPRNINQEE